MRKKYTCKVCGRKFELKVENKYMVTESKGISEVFCGITVFDAFDCPFCGCQNVMNVREPEYLP